MILLPSEWNSIHDLIYIYIAQFSRNYNTDSVRGPIIYSRLKSLFVVWLRPSKQPGEKTENKTQSKGTKGFQGKNSKKCLFTDLFWKYVSLQTSACTSSDCKHELSCKRCKLLWLSSEHLDLPILYPYLISRLPKSRGQKLNPQSLELGSPVSSVSY